jgi:hypothetical protein
MRDFEKQNPSLPEAGTAKGFKGVNLDSIAGAGIHRDVLSRWIPVITIALS